MKTALFEDGLFSRKGEAQPAIQAAIAPHRPNRFEMLARGLGVEPVRDDADQADHAGATVTPLRPLARPAETDDPETLEETRPEQPVWEDLEEVIAPEALAGTDDPQPHIRPPWVRLVFSSDAPERLSDQGSAARPLHGTADEIPGLELGLGLEPDPGPRPDRRRRRVSVRLPEREHALLRQFSHVCGQTLQDIVRRSILTYMIGDLTRRLEDDPDRTDGRESP
jgi:hypothetical protein